MRYQLKTPWRNGTTHVEFEPIEFIAKLAALELLGELPRKDTPPALATPPTIPQAARKGRLNFLYSSLSMR